MTPSARLSAAITLLDEILAGEPAERGLTRWARQNRYAGSKDRAAVRDIVFDCLRQKRSLANVAGEMSGRGLVLGHEYKAGGDLAALFSGERFAPEPLSAQEQAQLGARDDSPLPVALDFPDFMLPELMRSLGGNLPEVMGAMAARARRLAGEHVESHNGRCRTYVGAGFDFYRTTCFGPERPSHYAKPAKIGAQFGL